MLVAAERTQFVNKKCQYRNHTVLKKVDFMITQQEILSISIGLSSLNIIPEADPHIKQIANLQTRS